MMQIQAAAAKLAISERSLRHYEAAGLVRPERRANGYRHYSDENLRRAAWVRDLVALGFSLREIRELALRPPSAGACARAFERKLAQVEDRAAELSKRRAELRRRLARAAVRERGAS